MARRGGRIVAAILIVVSFISCREPIKRSAIVDFGYMNGWQEDNKPVLRLDIRDTIAKHNVLIIGQIYNNESIENERYLFVKLKITSPDSLFFSDTLTLPLNVDPEGENAARRGRIVEYEWPFLKGATFNKAGEWSFEFSQLNSGRAGAMNLYKYVYSIGVRYE